MTARHLERLTGSLALGLALLLPGTVLAKSQTSSHPPETNASSTNVSATLVSSQAAIAPGAEKGGVDLILQIPQIPPKVVKVDNVEDLKIQGEPTVTVTAPVKFEAIGTGADNKALYKVSLDVHGLPIGYSQTRYLSVVLDGRAQVLSYTLTNQPTDKAPLTAHAGAMIGVQAGDPVPIYVATGNIGITGLTIEQGTLVESQTRESYGKGKLELCFGPPGATFPSKPKLDCPPEGLELRPHRSRTLWIRGGQAAGNYSGSINLRSRQIPEGAAIPQISVYVTNCGAKSLGAFFIALGVLLWFVPSFLRTKANRDQWLLQAARLRAQLIELKTELEKVDPRDGASETKNKIQALDAQLEPKTLELNGLPSRFVPVFQDTSANDNRTKLQAYLQTVSLWIEDLIVLIDEGLNPTGRRLAAATTQAEKEALQTSLTAIDRLAAAVVVAPPSVDSIRQGIAAALAPAAKPGLTMLAATGSGTRIEKLPTAQALQVQLSVINAAGWVYVLAVTFLVGCYQLCLSSQSASYGVLPDFIVAFLWGVGFPMGTQIASNAVAAALGANRQILPGS